MSEINLTDHKSISARTFLMKVFVKPFVKRFESERDNKRVEAVWWMRVEKPYCRPLFFKYFRQFKENTGQALLQLSSEALQSL